jgi:hypothetical protein
VGFSQGTAEDGKVLAEDADLSAVDRTVATENAVAEILSIPAQMSAAAGLESVELLERALVEQ